MNKDKLKKDISKGELEISVNYKPKRVKLSDYVTAKTKSLIEFGYTDLTESEVKNQLQAIADEGDVNVIGMMMERDLNY